MSTIVDRAKMPLLQEVKVKPFPEIIEFSLSNGVPVYLISQGLQEVAEVRLLFNKHDFFDSHSSQSSFCATLATEGTRGLNSKEFGARQDFFGASIGAEFSKDFISFFLSSLTKYLPETITLLREATFFPAMHSADFELARQRFIQNLEVHSKETGFMARRHFNRICYGPNHPYGWAPEILDLEKVELKQIEEFHSAYIDISKMKIVVSGAVQKDRIHSILEEVFCGQPYPDVTLPPIHDVSLARFESGYHFFETEESQQATVRMGHPGPTRAHPDYYALELVNTIFGGFFGSRLMKKIREEKGFTYGISSGLASLRKMEMIIIQTNCANEYVENVRDEVKNEMQILIDKGCERKELELVKNYMFGATSSARDYPSGLADKIQFALIYNLPFSFFDEKIAILKALEPEDIQRIASVHFNPNHLLEVVCGTKNQ